MDIEQRLNDFEQCWNFLLIFSIFLKCLVTCGYVLASMMNFNIAPIFLLNSGTVRTLFQPPKPKHFPGALPPNPRQGRCPWTPLGAAPPNPAYILFRPYGRPCAWHNKLWCLCQHVYDYVCIWFLSTTFHWKPSFQNPLMNVECWW